MINSRIRLFLIGVAAITALLSTWQLVTAWAQPDVSTSGNILTSIDQPEAERRAIRRAAFIGIVRGDLWTAFAVAEAAPLLRELTAPMDHTAPTRGDLVRASAQRAVLLAPHDARAWLALAVAEARSAERMEQIAASLKMSFYTGPSEQDLMPARLALAARIESAPDEEMQLLIRHQLRAMLRQRSDIRPMIAGAYRNASNQGRRFLDATIAEVSPDLATWVRTQIPRP